MLPRFNPPGNVTELSDAGRAAWSERIRGFFTDLAPTFPMLFDPTSIPAAADQATLVVRWPAFPATVRDQATSEEGRWSLADSDRKLQDEYCEWSVLRNAEGKILRVTFTSETPEYYAQLLKEDEAKLQALYEGFTGHPVPLDTLRNANGGYDKRNQWNVRTDGPIAHLMQRSNTLLAAVQLVAMATELRHDADGRLVVNQQQLVECGGLGVPSRNSDPQIAAAVNGLAAQKLDVSLADPPGLYLDGIATGGMGTPDGADPASFWTVERGDADHVVRARFEVPDDDHPYEVGDITIGGKPIRFGAQLADRVNVKVVAIAQPGGHEPTSKPCVGP